MAARATDRFRLAPGVPDLAALGARDAGELFEPGRVGGAERGELLARGAQAELVRVALPGTPDASGRLTGRPRGAGTGHAWLRRYRARGADGWLSLLRARFTAPPSASLAEREWNLICHLRAHGVGTPEPLAVGARGRGPFARRSFLVVREPERLLTLPAWIESAAFEDARRRRGARALGACLRALFRSRTALPALRADGVRISREEGGCDERPGPAGVRSNRLPSVLLADFERGRVVRELPLESRIARLAALDDDTAHLTGATWRDRARTAARALADAPRATRHRAWRALVARRADRGVG